MSETGETIVVSGYLGHIICKSKLNYKTQLNKIRKRKRKKEKKGEPVWPSGKALGW